MATREFCDICGKEIEVYDRKTATGINLHTTPSSICDVDLCDECARPITDYLIDKGLMKPKGFT